MFCVSTIIRIIYHLSHYLARKPPRIKKEREKRKNRRLEKQGGTRYKNDKRQRKERMREGV